MEGGGDYLGEEIRKESGSGDFSNDKKHIGQVRV